MPLDKMNLTGQFLIAMPAMQDPYFSKTVTYICTHNEDGAMGIVINKPLNVTLDHLFEQIQIPCEHAHINQRQVFYGGPVQAERGFVLHSLGEDYNATIAINHAVALTTSKDILESAAINQGPTKMIVALGYAGWTAGQLEEEVSKNAWLSVKPNAAEDTQQLIFDLPFQEKLEAAMSMLGVNFASLSEVAGHA